MFWGTVLTASVLVVRAYAGIEGLISEGVLAGRNTIMQQEMAALRIRTAQLEKEARVMVKRQNASSSDTGVVLNADGSINMTAWEATANAACTEALNKLPVSTNPSGTCICYNLPALDNVTGTFEADLRLYQLSSPTGDFSGIPSSSIQVGLSYTKASVSPITSTTASKLVAARQSVTSTTTGLKLLQTYLFVGQINKDALTTNMNMAQLEAMVMPTVTLTGTNSSGKTVSTNVSSNEAAFVAGVFSKEVVMSELALAQAAVDVQTAGLANGTVAFVVPGIQLILFPIGLIITGIWLVIGVIAYGWGTIERMNYREQFMRRTAMDSKPMLSRI